MMKTAYQKLTEHYTQLHHLNHLSAICGWDQATMMPVGGNEARSAALAELAVLVHQKQTDPRIEEWLAQAEQPNLAADRVANLKAMRRQFEQARVLPESLVQAKSLAGSRCEHAWRDQRKQNDWKGFVPNLAEVVRLSREEAAIRAQACADGPSGRYDALLDLYEPGMTGDTLDRMFGDLKTWLPDLIEQVLEKQSRDAVIMPAGPFAIDGQKQLGEQVMKLLGFDFGRGRLDISVHPFCGGVPEDVRITTRYDQQDFSQSLMGIVHETGHARYEQGLPPAWLTQPVGVARSVGIHESQSLFFEMQLGRHPRFLAVLAPMIEQCLERQGDAAFSAENLASLYTRVSRGFIRVDADELTYPAHVMLRFEIERALIEGSIEVDDIPELWDLKMQNYLGLSTRNNYKDGCMQDIHWTDGTFGYFPSYTLGAMYAAQFGAAMASQLGDVGELIERSELPQIFSWLEQKVWRQASFVETDELVRAATGEALNPVWFRRHLESRYA